MIKTRFAPSPTGDIHIGNFRTALYAYMWAKKNKGQFMVRIEDTDRKRFTPESAQDTIDLFSKYGLEVDLKPTQEQLQDMEKGEPKVPQDWILDTAKLENTNDANYKDTYIQTQRLPVYLKYALKLVNQGSAYLCFCSEDRLTKLREEKKDGRTMYDGYCKKYSLEEALEKVKSGEKYVVRLDIKKFGEKHDVTKIEYDEPVYGKMRFPLSEIDDQVLVKSNGIPTYHLAVVIDDHLMDITHAMRGYGWLPSTPKQVILYKELGWDMPPYFHLTDILDPDGGKLSKRKGAVAAIDFLREGYLPEAILNFLAFLGWTPAVKREFGESERELYPFKELVRLFDIEGLNKSNPVFNREKLVWFNEQYIKLFAKKDFAVKVANWFKEYCEDKSMKKYVSEDKDLAAKVVLFQERMHLISELVDGLRFFYESVSVPDPKEIKGVKRYDDYKNIMSEYIEKVVNYENESDKWDNERWIADIRSLADSHDWKHGDMFMLIRLVICGSPVSPPLYESMQVLGKKEVIRRLEAYIKS